MSFDLRFFLPDLVAEIFMGEHKHVYTRGPL